MRECQKNANKKWSEENRERSNYLKNKSACKTFIRKRATLEDLEEISKMILEKKIELMKNRWYNWTILKIVVVINTNNFVKIAGEDLLFFYAFVYKWLTIGSINWYTNGITNCYTN